MILAAASSGSGDPSVWIAIVVAIIAMLGTIIAATVAAVSAKSNKRSELQAQRIGELENRISERKYEIYKPMVELLGDIVNANQKKILPDGDEVAKRLHEFSVWIGIYGSDEAVIAFRNFMQAAFNDVPPLIATRLYAELVLAARRDIGRSDTRTSAVDIIGMKISDLYTNADYHRIMTLPFNEVCERYGWTSPWSGQSITKLMQNPGSNSSDISPSQ